MAQHMPPSLRPTVRHRQHAFVLAVLAALVLAVPVAATGPVSRGALAETILALPAQTLAPAVAAEVGSSIRFAAQAGVAPGLLADVLGHDVATEPVETPAAPAESPTPIASVAPPATPAPAVAPTHPATTHHTATRPRTVAKAPASTPRYVGRNHVWIPSLGISRSVTGYACSRSAPPVNQVYRWGCAGANNVYLFGHAYSVFKPLHDAYAAGRLRTGMKVMYADGSGRVHTYSVSWWRLTTPDKGAFAYAALSRPSMTLQTCYGAQSQYRLIVRLIQVG